MTTSVHIVNLGPGSIQIRTVDPKTGEETTGQLLGSSQAKTVYVHDTCDIKIVEIPYK